MKKYIKNINIQQLQKFVCLFIILLAVTSIAHADVIGEPGGDNDAPIDGGLSLLVAAGVGYGVKKIKNMREKNSANNEIEISK